MYGWNWTQAVLLWLLPAHTQNYILHYYITLLLCRRQRIFQDLLRIKFRNEMQPQAWYKFHGYNRIGPRELHSLIIKSFFLKSNPQFISNILSFFFHWQNVTRILPFLFYGCREKQLLVSGLLNLSAEDESAARQHQTCKTNKKNSDSIAWAPSERPPLDLHTRALQSLPILRLSAQIETRPLHP